MVREKRSETTTKNNYKLKELDLIHYGLINLGNSCFFNSTLQSLSVTRPLINLIETPPISSPVLHSLSSTTSTSTSTTTTIPESLEQIISTFPIPLSTAFVNLLNRLKFIPSSIPSTPSSSNSSNNNNNRKKTLNPSELLRVLGKKHEEYSGKTQEDSHELLRMLLDGMMMEEFDIIKKLKLDQVVVPLKVIKPSRSTQKKKQRRMTIVPTKPNVQITSPTDSTSSSSSSLLSNTIPPITVDRIEKMEDGDDEQSEEEDLDEEEEDDDEESDEDKSLDNSSSSSSDSDSEREDEIRRKELVTEEEDKQKLRPFVETIFGGKLESFIVCGTCQHVSLSTEDFLDLSLSLKETPSSPRIRKRDRFRNSFFSSNSSSSKPSSSSNVSSASTSASPSPSTSSIPLRNITSSLSQSETEGSASGISEAETERSESSLRTGNSVNGISGKGSRGGVLTDEDGISHSLKKGEGLMGRLGGRGLGRSQSLDTKHSISSSSSSSTSKKGFWSSGGNASNSNSNSNTVTSSNSTGGASLQSTNSHPPSHLNPAISSPSDELNISNSNPPSLSRDTSPLGRALSSLTSSSRSKSKSRFSSSTTTSTSTTSKSSSKPKKGKIPKPTTEQLNYVKKILREISPSSPGAPGNSNNVAGQLRWSMPDKSQSGVTTSVSAGSGEKITSGKIDESYVGTDLYDCLISFTAVEILEGENQFACQNCWKLLNPDLVERARGEKLERRNLRLVKRRLSRSSRRSVNVSGVENDLENGKEREKDILPVSPAVLHFAPDLELDELDLNSTTITTTTTFIPNSLSSSINSTTDEEIPLDVEIEDAGGGGNSTDTSTSNKNNFINIIPPTPLTTANVDLLTAPSLTSTSTKHQFFSSSTKKGKDSSSHSITSTTSSPSLSALTSRSIVSSISPPSTNINTTTTNSSKKLILPPKSSRHILRSARKRYLISSKTLPPVLVIQFKRFQQSKPPNSTTSNAAGYFFGSKTVRNRGGWAGGGGGTPFTSLKKRDDPLSFSLRLDVKDFLAPLGKGPKQSKSQSSSSGGGSRREEEDLGRGRAKTINSNELLKGDEGEGGVSESVYELYSVVCHAGSLKEGHYISYVLSDMFTEKRKRGFMEKESVSVIVEDQEEEFGEDEKERPRTWIYCSDHEVRMSSVEEVLKSKAYILFYEKINSCDGSNSINRSKSNNNDIISISKSHI